MVRLTSAAACAWRVGFIPAPFLIAHFPCHAVLKQVRADDARRLLSAHAEWCGDCCMRVHFYGRRAWGLNSKEGHKENEKKLRGTWDGQVKPRLFRLVDARGIKTDLNKQGLTQPTINRKNTFSTPMRTKHPRIHPTHASPGQSAHFRPSSPLLGRGRGLAHARHLLVAALLVRGVKAKGNISHKHLRYRDSNTRTLSII